MKDPRVVKGVTDYTGLQTELKVCTPYLTLAWVPETWFQVPQCNSLKELYISLKITTKKKFKLALNTLTLLIIFGMCVLLHPQST